MGFLDLLSGGLTAATNAAGAYQGAQAQNKQRDQQTQLSLYNLIRQKQNDEQENLVRQSQIGENTARVAGMNQDIADKKAKGLGNQKNYNALKVAFPDNPFVQSDFDPTTDYTSEYANAQKGKLDAAKQGRTQQAAYNTLKLEFADDPLSKGPFDSTNPADYVAALANARDLRKVGASKDKHHWFQAGIDPTTGQPLLVDQTSENADQKIGGGFKQFAPKSGAASGTGAQASVDDMTAQLATIKRSAEELQANKWQITPGMQMKEGLDYGTGVDNAGGHPTFTKPALSAAINLFGQAGSPEDYQKYQNLMFATRAIGDDAAKVFKGRQNEQAVLREVKLAQLSPEDYKNPERVKAQLLRLQNIINLAASIMPGHSPSSPVVADPKLAPPAAGGTSTAPPSYEEWKKANGIP